MMQRLSPGAIFLTAALAAPAIAVAAPPPPSPSPAQALFDRGIADMEARRFEKACPAIEASQRMEPMPGTLFALAECEAQRGRSATALRYYGEYLALYRAFTFKKKLEQRERAETSQLQLKKLGVIVPRLTLKLPADSGSDVVVKRDGEVVAELSLGTAMVVDPGTHVVTTQVPGGPETPHRIALASGEARTLELTVQRHAPASIKPPAPGPSALAEAPPDLRPWHIGVGSAAGVTLAGLVVGVVVGVLAIEQRNRMSEHCMPNGGCDGEGLAIRDRVAELGLASTVGFVAGGIGLTVGVALLVATPSMPVTQPPGNPTQSGRQTSSTPWASSPQWMPMGAAVSGHF